MTLRIVLTNYKVINKFDLVGRYNRILPSNLIDVVSRQNLTTLFAKIQCLQYPNPDFIEVKLETLRQSHTKV
jgi:hypothetical protein